MSSINKVDPKLTNKNDLDPIISEIEPYSSETKPPGVFKRFIDGFRAPLPEEKDHVKDQNKVLTSRHLKVIALSSGLGTGLLVAAGSKLRTAGPLFVLLAYFILGFFMLFPTMNAAGELSITYSNLSSGFNEFYRKFIDESAAYAISVNYCFQWMIVISLELVTASMTIKFWNSTINPDIFVTIFFVVVISINAFGTRGYGEAEFVMNLVKITMLLGFVIFGLCVDLGASPDGFIGGKYWHDPGFYTSFKGLATVFVTGAFSFGGTEFISLTVADQANPRKSLKSAVKYVLYRIIFLFLGSLLLVGLLVPYNSDQLMGSGGSASHASPYVLAAEIHGVKVIPHIINAVILNSTTSVATAAMYSSTRLLHALAVQGYVPKVLKYVDRSGRPLYCWFVTIFSGLLAYISVYKEQETVFNWLLSISALSFIFVWMAICVCHLRFRYALKYHNIPVSSLAYISPTGEWGSYLSITINCLILVAQFWIALFPKDKPDANNFFQNYLGVIFLLVCYVGHKLYTRNWQLYIRVEDIDIDADRTIYDPEILELEKLEDKERYAKAPWWKKMYITFLE